MRLVKVSVPEGRAQDIAKIVFAAGVSEVSVSVVKVFRKDGNSETKETIDFETSTPKAKSFVDALLAADFYSPETIVFNTRQPQSLISGTSLRELTRPLAVPVPEILEELWQFSHITIGFVGRVAIAGSLLAFGLIERQILLMIAGLLFLPLLPLLMAVAFGIRTAQLKLIFQGAAAFLTTIILMILCGMVMAAFSGPPIRYDEFNSPGVSVLISAAVGIAAALAMADDAGRRELIGLAATAQLAMIPVWFGICLIFGFPGNLNRSEIIMRGVTFFLNTPAIIAASLLTYIALGAASGRKTAGNRL